MRRARPIVIGALAGASVIALFLWWLLPEPFSTGELTLPDGTTARVISVTHGTSHECGTFVGRYTRWLPPSAQQFAAMLVGPRALAWSGYTGSEPSFLVWIERLTNNLPTSKVPTRIYAVLADESGERSGRASELWPLSPVRQAFQFHAMPRRGATINLNLLAYHPNSPWTNIGTVIFKNPLPTNHLQWVSDTFPITNHAEDVKIVLHEITKAKGWNYVERKKTGESELVLRTADSPYSFQYVGVASIKSKSSSNQVWAVEDVVLSDATGNTLDTKTKKHWQEPYQGWFEFEGALWTNEFAWKVDLELTRRSGFSTNELITFHNVPLGQAGATTTLEWATNFDGNSITLANFLRRPPIDGHPYDSLLASLATLKMQLATNVHLNIVQLKLNNGITNSGYISGVGSSRRSAVEQTYAFRNIPLNATAADITFSIQTSRWVQFTVKPTSGKKRIPLPPVQSPE